MVYNVREVLQTGWLVGLLGTSITCYAVNSSQIKDSYNICTLIDKVGEKAMKRGITAENISKPENQDIVKSIESIEQRFKDHQKKYGFNIDDQDLNRKDVPTLIGVFVCDIASGGSSSKTGKYLHYIKPHNCHN